MGVAAMLRMAQEALTFDDVLLVPGFSDVLPKDVSLKTRLTRNLFLNIPLLSAAMDTVTEARLAIAMAQEGGIGIIHKNMTMAQQAAEVRKVKKHESVIVKDPVTVSPKAKLEDLLAIRGRLVGSGYIGGKATGMLIARNILLKDDPQQWQDMLEPHDSSYLGTDAYYAFLVHNGLWPAIMRQRSPEGYLSEAPALHQAILTGQFPAEVRSELERLLDHYGQSPILVRSSSLQV